MIFANSEKTMNKTKNDLQKQLPFQLIYGTKPVALPEASEKTNSPVANDRINQLYKSREEALATHDLQLWTVKVHLFYSERMAHGNLLIYRIMLT